MAEAPAGDRYGDLVARSLSEATWQAHIVLLARALGLLCYHTLDSRGSDRGFPDLTLLGPGRLVLLELKRQARAAVLTTEQAAWLDGTAGLRDAGNPGVEVYLARPLDRDALVASLTGEPGGLHQWCLAWDCGRCTDERLRAKPARPLRPRTRR